jgi:4a-hydroxytetrahydrobiopterin dehydratase
VKSVAELLSESEIRERAGQLSGWTVEGQQLERTWIFKDFVEAIAFVNKLVEPAETAGHHPDIAISYNKVSVSLTTHDAGGLTEKDFQLALVISQLR